MKSCLKWIGGKAKNVNRYIDLMPKHRVFISPFCGACHVELSKSRVPVEIINDINDELVNFLLVLKDMPDILYAECEALPYSESLYNKFKWHPSEDALQRAIQFFYIVRTGFSGGGHKYKTGFSVSNTVSKSHTYITAVNLIPKMAKRIKDWNITCKDFEEVIKRYASKDALIFCDPPYWGHEDLYLGDFSEEDHIRLNKQLEKIEAMAMVCYYDCPAIRELYQGWNIVEYKVASKIQQRNFGEKCPVRTELILTNYDLSINKQDSIFNKLREV